ncbi:MAG: hypothetical protein PUH08_09655 [Treponema sp.]|nr:hypothetical protein [Spirochaetaceae bacterium]MDD7275920.1 hypothetical protein [Treponema sp.]MDY3754854.1 hypothetical protein [Treponema sp.]
MKKNALPIVLIGSILLFALVSCASTPEDMIVSTVATEEVQAVQDAAQQLAYLDGNNLLGNTDVAAAARLLELLQDSLEDPSLPAAARSQLLAYRGRVNLILGDKKAAKADYEQALSLNQSELQAEILGVRLGLVSDIGSLVIGRNQQPYVLLEKALANYKKENYLEAVAQFDEAFISLDEFYREAYGQLREHAWRLRNISTSGGDQEYRALLKQDKITLTQMISVIQGQGDLLYKYTGAKKQDANQVLRQLKSQGLFYSINSWTDVEQLTKDTILTRSLAARFLWNLYHDRRGTLGNAPKYSHQFISSGSPILDVPLDSPDFDAILGSIEKELLDLPDGMNFYPDQPMSGMDFNESIKKIR